MFFTFGKKLYYNSHFSRLINKEKADIVPLLAYVKKCIVQLNMYQSEGDPY